MNKMIARRNGLGRGLHGRRDRAVLRAEQAEKLAKWWNKLEKTGIGTFKFWRREDKKAWLMPTALDSSAYGKWLFRHEKHAETDPNMPLIVGRHVQAPRDVCWSEDRRFHGSLVKVNAQGRRRKF